MDHVWRAIEQVRPREIRLFMLLTFLRGLGRTRRNDADLPLLDVARAGGFAEIGRTDHELVLGTIGQFWRLRPRGCQRTITSPESFMAFAEPGFAKAAINFLATPREGGILLVTETRIAAFGDARRRFAMYWRLILPGSALIRRQWLAAIRRRAGGRLL